MTLDELDRWLDTYGRAWERKDVDAFVGCFVPDAVYYWGPSWDEALRGRDQIRARTEKASAGQEAVRFGHEPLATTPDGRGLARWWVSLDVTGGATVELEGIFLVTLDDEGLCTDFREWWNERVLSASS
jgi:hypothetical protein